MYEDDRGYAQVGSYPNEVQGRLGNQAKQGQIYTAAQEKYMRETEPCRVDATISGELKQLDALISEVDSAAQDFIARVSPILFFGPECGNNAAPSDCPPGSDVARTLYQYRERLIRVAIFLRECSQKVNL